MGNGDISIDAIVLIDMQPEYLNFLYNPERVDRLLEYHDELLASANVPIIPVEFRKYNPTISRLASQLPKRTVAVRKSHADAFQGTPLLDRLRSYGAQQVLCTGVYSTDCVQKTMTSNHGSEMSLVTAAELTADYTSLEKFGPGLPPELLVPYEQVLSAVRK